MSKNIESDEIGKKTRLYTNSESKVAVATKTATIIKRLRHEKGRKIFDKEDE